MPPKEASDLGLRDGEILQINLLLILKNVFAGSFVFCVGRGGCFMFRGKGSLDPRGVAREKDPRDSYLTKIRLEIPSWKHDDMSFR